MSSPHLALPYIQAAQAQKEITHNEALNRLDALVQLSVIDRDRAAPPADPATGQRHIVAAGATGAWSGRDGCVAAWYAGWLFLAPAAGWRAWVTAESVALLHDGGGWQIDAPGIAAVAAHEAAANPHPHYQPRDAILDRIVAVAAAGVGVDAEPDAAAPALWVESLAADTTLGAVTGKAYRVDAAAVTLTLPPAAETPEGWWCRVKHRSGGGSVTIAAQGADGIDGAAAVTLADGEAALVVRTGPSSFEVF